MEHRTFLNAEIFRHVYDKVFDLENVPLHG